MLTIGPATSQQLAEVLGWLEQEQLEMSEGFYCNRDIIVQSFGSGEMYCAISQQSVVGFVLHTLKTAGSSIDILEIRPSHRRRGFGKQLAL